ncbi:N-acetylmuramoyl-L-alanine amidase, partial [Candidatus Sumerlaeota bacterium]|nr:N-acetylmuramoyl-L-alanine amidase [Candidatus Sumerlaeota bacterium]
LPRATPEEGGAYAATILIGEAMRSGQLHGIQFKLTATERRRGQTARQGLPSPETITMTSALKLRKLPTGLSLMGVVRRDFATFLKAKQGWERWGNWIAGTPFPVIEKWGERVAVDFGRGETGFVEAAAVTLLADPVAAPYPRLPMLDAGWAGRTGLRIAWEIDHPIAAVFHHRVTGAGDELRVSLIGADDAEARSFTTSDPAGVATASYIRSARILAGDGDSPPQVRISFRDRELWGYDFGMNGFSAGRAGGGERRPGLIVRTRPDLQFATPDRPLARLRIMIDAGHGGESLGALGPSGLVEADVNLTLAAMLGLRLEALGADVSQLRVSDVALDLDDRVAMALSWQPDLFISVHHNSVGMGTDPFADRGPKVFYHYDHSRPLAQAIAEELTTLLTPGEEPRALREVFRVNRNISFCPSVLIEGGFVCNPEDEIRLRDEATLQAMADAIARGVTKLMIR